MAIKLRVLELMHAAGFTQEQLARRARISPTTVRAYCKNRTKQASLRTLDRLCRALKVEPGKLFVRTPGPHPSRRRAKR